MTLRGKVPEPIRDLVATLQADGFSVARAEYFAERFGDQVMVLVRGQQAMRVVSDRSDWFVELAGPGQLHWHSPAVWLEHLEGLGDSRSASSLEDECRVATRLLPHVRAAISEGREPA
jgi:hypothetical protein